MNSIIGSWKLLTFEVRESGEDGRVQRPYGADVSGTLIYEQRGSMCEIIVGNTRPHTAAVDAHLMLDQDKIALAENFRGVRRHIRSTGRQNHSSHS